MLGFKKGDRETWLPGIGIIFVSLIFIGLLSILSGITSNLSLSDFSGETKVIEATDNSSGNEKKDAQNDSVLSESSSSDILKD